MKIALITLLVSSVAFAAPSKVTTSVQTAMTRAGAKTGAFCYAVENGAVEGYNQDKPVRVASVMKLLTTFWAVELLGPNYRFNTRVYIQPSNGEMHLSGTRDPFLDRQRLFLLLADLNRLGYKHMNRITADGNVRFDLQALDFTRNWKYSEIETHAGTSLAAADIKNKLTDAFNTAGWSADRKKLYVALQRSSSSPKLPAGVVFKADAVDVVPGNPLAGKPGVLVYDLKSAPLKMYLKEMNIMSINPVADEMFASLGGPGAFRAFMKTKYGMATEFNGVFTGSGLPTHGVRHDTTVSCSTVVRLIRRMDMDLESKYHSDLSEVMMISGVDTPRGATFSDNSRSLIVKTGTLTASGAQAKNLAGVEETNAGEVYFGIFLQGTAAHSWNVRTVLTKMMTNFRAKRVAQGALVFDALDPAMQLQLVSPKIAVPPLLRKP